jgi:hypothetical protein
VALPSLCLCTSGTTWYEREFGAHIRDPADRQRYRHLVQSLLQAPDNKAGTIADLFSQARADKPGPDAYRLMETCYASASTLQAFFCALKGSRSREDFCMLVGHWVEPLLDSMLDKLHRKEWLIPAHNFQDCDIQVHSSSSKHPGLHQGRWRMPLHNDDGCMFHPREDM